MKVAALFPDRLIRDAQKITGSKTITESLIRILDEWIKMQKIKDLHKKTPDRPLIFIHGFSAFKIREKNRRV